MRTSNHVRYAGIAGVLLALVAAIPAFAHADLVSSTPEDGAARTGEAAKDGSKVMTLDGLALGPGGYTIKWTAVAEDGHVERGALTFTVAEAPSAAASPAPASPTAAQSSAPASASSAPASSAPASTAPASEAPVSQAPASEAASPAAIPSTPVSSGSDALIPIVVGLLLVGGVGAFVLRRSRRA